MTMNNVNRNLRHLIDQARMNPSVLAHRTGVPQPTIFRILSGESADPRTSTLSPIAEYFNVSVEMLRSGNLQDFPLDKEPGTGLPIARAFRRLQVAGLIRAEPDSVSIEIRPTSPEAASFVDYPARDQRAYALMVRGDSLRPRVKSGEYVIVEPGYPASAGDDVIVVLHDGQKLLRELLYTRQDEMTLAQINGNRTPMSVSLTEIHAIHPITGIRARQ